MLTVRCGNCVHFDAGAERVEMPWDEPPGSQSTEGRCPVLRQHLAGDQLRLCSYSLSKATARQLGMRTWRIWDGGVFCGRARTPEQAAEASAAGYTVIEETHGQAADNNWTFVDPRLRCGVRVQVHERAGPLLEEWGGGLGIPIAGARRAGMLGTVVDYHDADSMHFMAGLYRLRHPKNAPWVRVLFDDAPIHVGSDGQTSISYAESLPAVVCQIISGGEVPERHREAAAYACEVERRQAGTSAVEAVPLDAALAQ